MAAFSALLLVNGLASLAVAVFTTVLFPLLVVRLYRSLAGPGQLSPEIAERGSLGGKPSGRVPGKVILGAAAATVALVVVAFYLVLRDVDWREDAQIIAHRGGAAVAPENTLAAFRRGIADGAAWLELDVQENADGVVVIEHDRDFMRVGATNLEVWQATGAELADLDALIVNTDAWTNVGQMWPTLQNDNGLLFSVAPGAIGPVDSAFKSN